jgi:hypothetical protein
MKSALDIEDVEGGQWWPESSVRSNPIGRFRNTPQLMQITEFDHYTMWVLTDLLV